MNRLRKKGKGANNPHDEYDNAYSSSEIELWCSCPEAMSSIIQNKQMLNSGSGRKLQRNNVSLRSVYIFCYPLSYLFCA